MIGYYIYNIYYRIIKINIYLIKNKDIIEKKY